MLIKIYINNKPLYLVSDLNKTLEKEIENNSVIYFDELNKENVQQMLQAMDMQQNTAGIFKHHNVTELFTAFLNEMNVIKAGGGLVYNNQKEILMIYRRGKWDLPKGKLDEGETIEACAVREVKEETGLTHVQLIKPLCITYHTYWEGEKRILKESHWYLMQENQPQVFTPQTEEDIDKCEWVRIENLTSYLNDTHLSIIDVVKKGIEELQEVKNI